MLREPICPSFSRCVYPNVTTISPGSWRCTSALNSRDHGHFVSGAYRLLTPNGYPDDGPSSLICGSRSPFRSQPMKLTDAHSACETHRRVSLTVLIGLTRSTMLLPTGVMYRFAANLSAVLPSPPRS